jgi:hypothetical protein
MYLTNFDAIIEFFARLITSALRAILWRVELSGQQIDVRAFCISPNNTIALYVSARRDSVFIYEPQCNSCRVNDTCYYQLCHRRNGCRQCMICNTEAFAARCNIDTACSQVLRLFSGDISINAEVEKSRVHFDARCEIAL